MDAQLPEHEIEALLVEVREAVPDVRGFHDVRTRRAGPTVFVDVHVQLDRGLSFVEAHRLSEQVVRALERARPGAHVNVHADPHPLLPSDLG
jgi:ferrous-iron efflux pump FieF